MREAQLYHLSLKKKNIYCKLKENYLKKKQAEEFAFIDAISTPRYLVYFRAVVRKSYKSFSYMSKYEFMFD